MSDEAEILRKAKSLIDTPEKWAKGAFARLATGEPTESYDPDAVCFCVSGAINSAKQHAPRSTTEHEVFREAIGITSGSAFDWNDAPERTHAEVMAAFDKAIELAEAQ